jgi:hypothetical protein
MKRHFSTLIVFAFSIFVFSTLSWAQCPEDTCDRGECDTLNVICLDCEQSPGSGPYLVSFPLLFTHDQIDYIDSIGGFCIPLRYTSSNPAAFCSTTFYNNDICVGSECDGLPDWVFSIFRHQLPDSNWFESQAKRPFPNNKVVWDNRILDLQDQVSVWWLTCSILGTQDQMMWEGSRRLIATMTFNIEDTMHVCIDTTFWPPANRLKFGRYDAQTYVPRHNLPYCFWIGPPQIRVTSPNGGESWTVGNTEEITWLSENFDGTDVKIEYSTNSGTDWLPVTNSTPNTGSYFWPIPDTPSEYCQVKVSDADDEDPNDISDADFSITPPPDFTIEVDPDTQEVQAGNSVNFDVILESLYGFAASCTLTATDLPPDASESFNPNPLVPPGTSDLQINTAVTTTPGTYNVTVTASEITDKVIAHSDTLVLIVTPPPPDFTIEASPETLEVPQGGVGGYEVILTALYGFDSPCTLTVSGLPADASGEFDPPTLVPTDTSALTITVAHITPTGTYPLTITATEIVGGKQVEHTKDVVLVVTLATWSFYIEAYPDSQRVVAGNDTTYEVTIIPNIGFTAPCTLSIESGMPADASYDFAPNPIPPNDTSILTISTAVSTPAGMYGLVIKGKANAKQWDTTTVFLRVDEYSDAGDWADNPNAPKSFALFQNQPNPFNPETKISYYLPRACQVSLSIYNVLGRRVKTLFDGHQEAGMQTLLWDGRDDDGEQLSSGIYFYRLQADNFHQTKKMTLVK